MDIRKIPADRLNPAAYNPRKDLQPGDKEYEKLKRSVSEFGSVEPIVWNERTGNIVGGHQRFKVLRDLGKSEVSSPLLEVADTSSSNGFQSRNAAIGAIHPCGGLFLFKEKSARNTITLPFPLSFRGGV